MVDTQELTSLQGVKFRETVVTEVSKVRAYRHFGVPPSGGRTEEPLGPLALFSFVGALKAGPAPSSLQDSLRFHCSTSNILHAKEKGVMYPVIHFTEDRDALKKRLSDEHILERDYVLYQGVYREVRSIRPERNVESSTESNPKSTSYILIGFKSLDKQFSQEVMVDSWKDWTGARHIYMYLPDEFGMRRISFYQREAPHSINTFLYVVLVECCSVTTLELQMKLVDFAQRLRSRIITGYISVYGVK